MKTLQLVLALAVIAFFAVPSVAAQNQSSSAASSAQPQSSSSSATVTTASGEAAQSGASRVITAYSLPPHLHKKAHDLNRIYFRLALIGFVYGIVVLWLVLRWRLAPKYRDWSEHFSSNSFLQSLVFSPLLLLTIAKYETPSGRLIQRDYSNGELYNYYTEGGSMRDDNADVGRPKGAESKTDTGRAVYSGGGINPDVVVKPKTITIDENRVQQRIANPVFGFALDLVVGKVKGLESYKVERPIIYDYDIKTTDFPINEAVYAAFKQYAADKYKITPAQIDHEREFVERTLRTELITAAYGSQTSFQVFNEYDNQLLKGIDLLPQAKQLAIQGERARATASKQKDPSN